MCERFDIERIAFNIKSSLMLMKLERGYKKQIRIQEKNERIAREIRALVMDCNSKIATEIALKEMISNYDLERSKSS